MAGPSTLRAIPEVASVAIARERIRSLRGSKIREIANAGMGDPGVLPFWFGEPDLVTPQFIRDAAIESIARGETFYSQNFGIPELRGELARYVSRLHGATSDGCIAVTASGMSALMLTVEALVSPGDRMVVGIMSAPNRREMSLVVPSSKELTRLAEFQLTDRFFSSPEVRHWAEGGAAPSLPMGKTESEKRGRRFFADLPPNPANFPEGLKDGLCSSCHSGPLLNQANEFLQLVVPGAPKGTRFQDVGVSEFNALGNPARPFVFTNADGTTTTVVTPDPGRALITGVGPKDDPTFEHVNSFKISPLRGVRNTAPYFHDNSAKTLEDVVRHYANFFAFVSNGVIVLSDQDQADIVAYLKLL